MSNQDTNNAPTSESQESPLVTFALFAYNQEKYIREAVEGAFSQTYQPLEIILSDDCSTDRTFEIMQEMAAAYRGPHRVMVRRSPANRGLGLHIRDAVELATGAIIVVAAGDDISLPNRTAAIVGLMEREGTQFAASNYNKMDDEGNILDQNLQNDYSGNYVWQLINAEPEHFASGAAAAYRKHFIRSALQAAHNSVSSGNLFNEDILIAAYAAATNEKPSNYADGPLIHYRINPNSLSNFLSVKRSWQAELSTVMRESFRSKTRLATLKTILEIAEQYPGIRPKLNKDRIASDMRSCETEIAASAANFSTRLRSLLKARTSVDLRICAPRLFGLKTLATLRFIRTKLAAY